MSEQNGLGQDRLSEGESFANSLDLLSSREKEELAQKIYEMFLTELIIENERIGRL